MRLPFELLILGSNSATPAHGRFPTSQVLKIGNDLLLIDCGEGCQVRMSQYKVKRHQISTVLISHLHGDHVYGLPGVLGSLSHHNRKEPLTIYGPHGIRKFVNTILELSASHMNYELIIKELDNDVLQLIEEQSTYSISAFPVNHRVSTYGYMINEKVGERNIIKEKIPEFNLTVKEIKSIKAGFDLQRQGVEIKNSEITRPLQPARSYAFCADTMISGWEKEHLRGVHTMYLETTYLHELQDKAHERMHTTAKEAGKLALELQAENLIIGHYSSRYKDPEPLLIEATQEFASSIMGYDGLLYKFK